MTAYLIADIKITNDQWVPAYAASVHELVRKHGGKYLSRSGNVKTLEGKPLDTTLIGLMEFPSATEAEAFVSDPDYAPFVAARQAGSESRFQLIDGTDLAGTIPVSPEGLRDRLQAASRPLRAGGGRSEIPSEKTRRTGNHHDCD